jgi:hypothetical protein
MTGVEPGITKYLLRLGLVQHLSAGPYLDAGSQRIPYEISLA